MPAYTWSSSETQPSTWDQWVRACNGGVFHTPISRLLTAQTGTPVYWHLTDAVGTVCGIALGQRSGCRIAFRQLHMMFGALPALVSRVDPEQAIRSLRTAVQKAGIAQAELGSLDGTYTLTDGVNARLEYIVPIDRETDAAERFGTTHRRHVRRGERDGWTTRFLTGPEALDAVLGVQRSTAERAASLSRGFEAADVTRWVDAVTPALPLPATGLAAIGAYDGDALLSAVLAGWSGERSFYIIGGSTPDGYKRGAAAWLHVQIMRMLADTGIRTYNLGGTPVDAANESSASHGLYRFKTGFGIEPVERRGLLWTFDERHMALHRLVDRLLRRS